MPFDAPFPLGPFTVDANGRLAPVGPDASPGFLFRWRDRVVRARMTQSAAAAEGRLLLQVPLGRVPSSAGGTAQASRRDSFALVRMTARAFPPDWRIGLLPDHRVRLETDAPLALPITASGLLVELTRFLLALAPYLDLFDETGMAVPAWVSAATGTENT